MRSTLLLTLTLTALSVATGIRSGEATNAQEETGNAPARLLKPSAERPQLIYFYTQDQIDQMFPTPLETWSGEEVYEFLMRLDAGLNPITYQAVASAGLSYEALCRVGPRMFWDLPDRGVIAEGGREFSVRDVKEYVAWVSNLPMVFEMLHWALDDDGRLRNNESAVLVAGQALYILDAGLFECSKRIEVGENGIERRELETLYGGFWRVYEDAATYARALFPPEPFMSSDYITSFPEAAAADTSVSGPESEESSQRLEIPPHLLGGLALSVERVDADGGRLRIEWGEGRDGAVFDFGDFTFGGLKPWPGWDEAISRRGGAGWWITLTDDWNTVNILIDRRGVPLFVNVGP